MSSAALRDAVREMNKGNAPVYSVLCTVDNINLTDMTCDCTPLDDTADFLGVRLMAQAQNGWTIIPKDGSVVVVTQINKATGYISMFSEIDEVRIILDSGHKLVADSSGFIFNDGTLDGLPKVNDTVTKLNNLESLLNNVLTAIGTTWIPVANDGGAALKALFVSLTATILAPLTPTIKADLENPDIKQ